MTCKLKIKHRKNLTKAINHSKQSSKIPTAVEDNKILLSTDSPLGENSNKTRRKEMFDKHLKEVFISKHNIQTRLLTWRIVIIHSNREIPRHVGNWVPPLYCEVDTCILLIQLRKNKTI